jgi:hypothetical protein
MRGKDDRGIKRLSRDVIVLSLDSSAVLVTSYPAAVRPAAGHRSVIDLCALRYLCGEVSPYALLPRAKR